VKKTALKNGRSQERERQALIHALEEMLKTPGTPMGRRMITLRLKALKAGQRLLSMDEILRMTGHDHA
jgi:hypothetical protein